ncbi:hypothetical protein NUU61_000827 [Penicillium alfredii]|uniref:CCCH zinc finger domain protein n=1 Tax=Penicillium alfredii TaxID=1506179 RepID=A0A9W9GAU2_9EURO|nr:uncharacterized protein NUU61_000827 [Penicillium alfredii]KAJ5115068.1 hypothetical protein NUU61_000827 [Penicillium alfredii]
MNIPAEQPRAPQEIDLVPYQGVWSYGVTANDIKLDLTAGKGLPEWIFSSYAPTRNVPRQLFGGPQREQSMEEMRVRHYELAAAGNMNQAVQEAQALWAESLKQIEVSLNDVNGAVKYINDGGNEHPNRIDITEGKTDAGAAQAPSAFGQPTALGQPSAPSPAPGAFGSTPSGFGKPGTVGQQAAFGQPSTLAQPTGFGQPSAFGQPSNLGQGTSFGQPSSLGGQPGFGKPAFGQSGFSQPATSQPAFGQTGFGQPSAPGAAPFGASAGASPFSQISQNQPTTGGFGHPSGQPGPGPSAFGQPSQQPAASSGFGQPSVPSAFGQPPPTHSVRSTINRTPPFGAPAQQPSAPSAFGQAAAPQGVPVEKPAAGPRAFIKVDESKERNPIPQLQGETRRDPASKRLTMWKGRPVQYINDAPCYLHPQDNKTYIRINFPDGPPDEASLRDSQGKPEEYTPEIVEMYKFFLENGYFKDGVIPPVPPKREWISFDF